MSGDLYSFASKSPYWREVVEKYPTPEDQALALALMDEYIDKCGFVIDNRYHIDSVLEELLKNGDI